VIRRHISFCRAPCRVALVYIIAYHIGTALEEVKTVNQRPVSAQSYYRPGVPLPAPGAESQQFVSFPPFIFIPFIFRIPPRRFIFIPRRRRRRYGVDTQDAEFDGCIYTLSEAEWECMQRLGIPECPVVVDR